ncbi:hypothetical protein PZA11_007502 [Diplocarpon coronariae]|nr:hypothetical protein JHW43_008720 [Diplocarpon mali]
MDGSQYGHQGNGINTHSPYATPNIAPHQLSQQQPPQPSIHHNTTLPPMQANQHATMPPHLQYPGSASHSPRNSSTPGTPVSANSMGNFPPPMGAQQQQQQQHQHQQQQQRSYAPQMMAGTSYQPQHQPQQYRTSSSVLPQSSMTMSHPPIAPAPMNRQQQQQQQQQQLRPMPPQGNSMHMQPGMHPYGQNNMGLMQDLEPPTHVVGSQGRRGILPSAPGRPAASTTATGKAAMIPAKDADGKFPCPHCTKTYLHAKHLKRHLLRHTGDRPYMCVLCRDTFSRSDILKRHFQKCSIRRGNPTGASHLSHAQAHLKKSHPGPHKSTNPMSNENALMGVNGMNGGPMNGGPMNGGPMNGGPMMNGGPINGGPMSGGPLTGGSMNGGSMNGGSLGHSLFGISPDGSVPDAASNMTDEQQEQLRQRAAGLGAVGGRDGRGMPGPAQTGSNRASFDQQSYPGSVAT